MADERRAIEDPMWIAYSSMPVPPLKFLMQPQHRPSGVVEKLAPSVTACHTPWFTEVAIEVTGVPGVAAAVVYVIPKDDETSLLAASIDQTFDVLFKLMSGADYGDKVTKLVAQHWPETYAMLVHSQNGTPGHRVLANVHAVGKVQWIVADELRGGQREAIDPQQAEALILAALQTVIRATNFYLDLPGVLDVLGGPDRTSRRLKAMSTLFTSGASVGSGVMDGVRVDELLDLAKGVREFVGGLIALKD